MRTRYKKLYKESDERKDISLCDKALDNLDALEFAITDMGLTHGMDALNHLIMKLKGNLKELKAHEEAEQNQMKRRPGIGEPDWSPTEDEIKDFNRHIYKK